MSPPTIDRRTCDFIQPMARRWSSLTRVVTLAVAPITLSSRVTAQTSDAVAESLFQDAKSYLQAEDYEHACPKLAQSYKIDPAGGTVLLLAICYEKLGRIASAWARYNEALATAKRDGREDRERRAREGLESVEPKLSYVKLTFEPNTQAMAEVVLSIDGVELPAISDTPLPVDTGVHQLAVWAPNHERWQTEITISAQRETQNVAVPALHGAKARSVPEQIGTPAATEPHVEKPPDRIAASNDVRSRRVAYVVGGAGVAAVAVGTYFGVRAIQLNHDANKICPTSQCRSDQASAITRSDQALGNAHAADVAMGIGSAAMLSAAVLLYVYRNDEPAVTANVDPRSRSMFLNLQRKF